MPTYLAFLRAINLGPTRKFPANAVRAATEAAGGREVVTYLNTGNVRLDSARRSASLLQRDLEAAYAQDRGFAVPTVVFTRPEVREIAARGRELEDEHGPSGSHYVTLYTGEPTAALVRALTALETPAACASRDMLATKALKSPPHWAASDGVASASDKRAARANLRGDMMTSG